MDAIRALKARYENKGLLVGIASMWIMFLVTYFGIIGGSALFATGGMVCITALMVFMIFIQ